MKNVLTSIKNYSVVTVLIILTAFSAIAQSDRNQSSKIDSYVIGKNRFTTVIDSDVREYYVHVPRSYDKSTKVPVVFMLHGTSGNGEKFYNISGWKRLGETENIITVFPSSWRHCIVEQGNRKITTKWNVYPGTFEYCKGETPKDDIKFLNTVIDELEDKFNVNKKMIYFVGFSNGGQMTARIGVEMSDRVAAIVSASGILHASTPIKPKRLIPNLFQLGTDDPLFMEIFFDGNPAPMDFEKMFQASPKMKDILSVYQQTYQLNPEYQTGGDSNSVIWLEHRSLTRRNQSVFRFNLIKGMKHVYPNGLNFPIYGARDNWNWLKQFELPPNQ